jgi:hypothetical protein
VRRFRRDAWREGWRKTLYLYVKIGCGYVKNGLMMYVHFEGRVYSRDVYPIFHCCVGLTRIALVWQSYPMLISGLARR